MAWRWPHHRTRVLRNWSVSGASHRSFASRILCHLWLGADGSPEQDFWRVLRCGMCWQPIFKAEAGESGDNALAQLHGDTREFMLHLDLDVIAQEEFPATNVPGSGGMSFAETQAALIEFGKHKNLLGLDVAQYNPDKDPDGSGAKKLIGLLADVLSARLTALTTPAAPAIEETPSTSG